MKKRILALILCLVMAVSLLPITAAAQEPSLITSACVTGSGFEKGADGAYVLKYGSWTVEVNDSDASGLFTGSTVGLYRDAGLTEPATDDPAGGGTYYLKYVLTSNTNDTNWSSNPNCSLVIPGYSTAYVNHYYSGYGDKGSWASNFYITFQVTKIHEHQWDLRFTKNSLTATCTPNCPIGEVSVTITASSVTLPNSPFNATVEVSENFKEAFPGAYISPIRYDYEDSEGVWHYDIAPIPANAKAGRYQAGVSVSGFSGNDEVAASAFSTDDGTNPGGRSVYLFVKYTAADPAITAQTGDNRPIELMMAGVAVFSVLAAAAFALDSKRKYRQ